MRSPTEETAARILDCLEQVDAERAARSIDPALQHRVLALKSYQHARFARTHADLLADPRYADAARFFLDDLYGPQDFAERDAQFARIVKPLTKLFPLEVLGTVASLAELHALTESLDSRMARSLPSNSMGAVDYVCAWQRTGEPDARQRQVDLVMRLGRQLDHYTHNKWLRQALRLMRRPAHAAGLASLQRFLERGFDTFGAMGGAEVFLSRIETRERQLIDALFNAPDVTDATVCAAVLGQLP